MGWKDFVIPFHVFKSGKPKEKADPYAALLAQLNPLIQSQTRIAEQESAAGLAHTASAAKDYDYVSKYLKSLFEGSDDELLKLLDASGATASFDENQQQLGELGVRGGARAASLGQGNFDRDSALNALLKQLRFSAPDKIANIAQAMGNLGLGELSASTGGSAAASQNIFGVEQLRQNDKDRRAALIGSIFSAIGGAAGAATAMCVAIGDSFISTPTGKKPIYMTKFGDEVLSFDKKTGDPIIRKIIRTRPSDKQDVRIITQGNRQLRATKSHAFYDKEFEELECGDLVDDDLLSVCHANSIFLRPIKILGEEATSVMILKLDDELESYPFIVNDFVCADDYPIR